jgi:hypothetical protein
VGLRVCSQKHALTIAFNLVASKSKFVMLLKNILMVAALLNVWCLYTYIGDLDKFDWDSLRVDLDDIDRAIVANEIKSVM